MALVLADRVQETTAVTGTGTATLLGAVTGYQSFAVVGNGNTTYYTIAGQTGSEWEVGIGTYTSSGTTLARTTILANSSGTQPSALSFSAGTKNVFVTYPSGKSVNQDASGNISNNTWAGTAIAAIYGGTGLTSPGTSGNVLTSNGSAWVSAAPSGGGSVMTYVRTSFIATAGQTAFTVLYTVGYLQVFVNGVLLATSDYTATSGTGFTLGVGTADGDIVEAAAFSTGAYTRTSFTATAGQSVFTSTYTVGNLQVYVNGVFLATSDYTATNGTSFTLGVAAVAGDTVEAINLTLTTSSGGITTGKSIAMAMIFGY